MNLLFNINNDILAQKVTIEMTVADFLSFYLAKMTCAPSEFEQYGEECFPKLGKDQITKLFTETVSTEEIEDMIDKIGIPHEKWIFA